MPQQLNKNMVRILWVLLALTLVLSYSGVKLRMSNEANNKTVVTTLDYREFQRTADSANMDLQDVLERLQQSGVNTVALSEITLRDLAYEGDAMISSYGDFSAQTRTLLPQLWTQVQKAVGSGYISPADLTVVTSDPATAAFLKERLGARYLPGELISFDIEGKSYFIINAQLSPINADTSPADKNKAVSKDLDARLGFEEKLLAALHTQGFNIILRPGQNTGSNTAYQAEYDHLVTTYGVKSIIFTGNDVAGSPDNLDWIEGFINRYHLIVGIIEPSTQLQYVKQNGLDEVMQATGYSVNRVYSSTNDEYGITIEERYYRWVRAVIDRGIRIVYIVPFKDQKLSYSENLNNTIDMLAKFHGTITAKGFSMNQPLPNLSGDMPGPLHRLMVTLSLFLGGTLYLLYLFRPKMKPAWMAGWLLFGAAGCLGANLVLPVDFSKLYALAAAIIYPSLSSLLLLLYLKHNREKPLMVQLIMSLAIILGINGLGMYTVVTSLADIRYIMNVLIFSGVKMAFLAPLLLFMVNYVSCMVGFANFRDNAIKFLLSQPNYLVLILIIVGGAAGYYYLGRSGNAVVSVSSLEIRLREVLESVFLARPRFKELLVGYPALLVMVYWYRKYKHDAILLVLGLGVMMGSISMVNSFCHVFTAVMVSINRTMAGLLTGVLIGIGALIVIKLGEWLIGRITMN
ncbi:MAG: DUF5693 family protein [Syntrophomonadaceae bacterium]|nr:DUF5693 family protein [Syntrophomonadaceae bacterium]